RPEAPFAIGLLLTIAAIISLTWHVASAPERHRWASRMAMVVATVWIAINVAMFSWRVGTLIPRSFVIAAYLPGSLLVPWMAWMFFARWQWVIRLVVSSLLLAFLVMFIAIFRLDGLSGDSNVNFSWRTVQPQPSVPSATEKSARSATGEEWPAEDR